MKRIDYVLITILFVLALFIWLRDTAWVSTAEDSLPILIAIPLFIWLGSPWSFRKDPPALPTTWFTVGVLLFLFGIALDITFLLGAGWTALLWGWLSSRIPQESLNSRVKLLVLPLMAFPWVTLDADRLGWWFRLSGAWTTTQLFNLLGHEVSQAGTYVFINGLSVSVEAACAGLNTLQSMLIAGTVAAYILLKDTSRFWWNLPLLILMAWIANTIRIITIVTAALVISPSFAMGAFHTFGGWIILLLMFAMCWLLFSLQEPKPSSP